MGENAREHGVTPEGREQRKALGFYKEAVAELGGATRSKFRLREWKPVYTKVLVLYQKGMTVNQIAAMAEIGFSARQLKMILGDPLFRLKLAQYNKKMDVAIIEKATEEIIKFPEVELARDKLLMSSEKAADLLIRLMRPRGEIAKLPLAERKTMLDVCRDVLDRAGLQKLSSSIDEKKGREYSPEEIRSALDNAKELEAISGRLQGSGSQFVLGTIGSTTDDSPTTVDIDPTDATDGPVLPLQTQTPLEEETTV